MITRVSSTLSPITFVISPSVTPTGKARNRVVEAYCEVEVRKDAVLVEAGLDVGLVMLIVMLFVGIRDEVVLVGLVMLLAIFLV